MKTVCVHCRAVIEADRAEQATNPQLYCGRCARQLTRLATGPRTIFVGVCDEDIGVADLDRFCVAVGERLRARYPGAAVTFRRDPATGVLVDEATVDAATRNEMYDLFDDVVSEMLGEPPPVPRDQIEEGAAYETYAYAYQFPDGRWHCRLKHCGHLIHQTRKSATRNEALGEARLWVRGLQMAQAASEYRQL